MIFKTKNNELAIFGKTLDEVKNKYTGFITAFKTNGLKGENGALSTLFGNKKQNVIDSSLISQFEKFKEEFNNSSMSAEALVEKIGIVDERIVNYAKTCKNGELTTKGFTTSLDEMSVGAKAGRVALQGLAMVGNMLAMVLVSKLVEGIYQLATYSSTLADKASEVGSAFKETESDIASYKVKIEDLQATINDSSSSYSDVTQARKDLMTIQDELINKYGSEEGAIKNITDAIKGQTSALDELTNTEYQKMVNDFNKTDFLGTIQNGFKGSNFQQMLDNMEGGKYRVTFAITGDKDFNKLLQDKFGAQLTGDRDMMITGNLQEVYDKLLEIQELSKQYDTGNFFNLLSGAITTAEDNLKDYKDIYNAYILHDKILNGNNDDFAKYYKEANDEYEKYKESVEKDGIDSETAKKNAQEYVDTVNQAMDKALTNGETGISNYFRTMHEDLINEVNSEDFEINFKANTDGIKDDLKNAVKEFSSGDDILSYNFDSATNDQRSAYAILTQYAKDYHMEVADLVALLEKLGIIASQTKNDLYNKLVPSENNGTAGVSATMSNNVSGVDPNETKKWIESISDEDATLIQDNMPAFNKALEEQKQGLNGASFSAQNYQNALDNMKQSLDDAANKTSVSSFSEAWSGAPDDLQTKLKELAEQGKLTKEEFENTDSENYFDGLGISADEAVNKINQLVSSSTQLESMSAQISKMSDMLADKKNGTTASASDLAGFNAEVRGLDSWEEFERVMGSSKSTMDECQKAANALATEWVNSGNFLANLTEENKDYYVTQLQNMGIENAEEVVTQELTRQKALLTAQAEYETLATEYNSDAKNENNQVTTDLTNATISEIAEIIAEGNATSDTQKAMAEFALSKFDVNNEKIDTSSDVKSIIAIANAAGASAEYVDALRIALENLVKAEKGKKQTSSLPTAGIGAAMANMAAEENVKYNKNAVVEALENAKKSIKGNKLKASDYIVKPTGSSNYKGGSSGGKSKSGSGKDKTKETKQTVDWIERKISSLNDHIDLTQSKLDNLFNIKSPKNLSKKIDSVNDKLKTAQSNTTKWQNALSKIKIPASAKKLIQSGKKVQLSKYSKSEQKNIKKYQSDWKKYSSWKKKASTLENKEWNLETQRGKESYLKAQEKDYNTLAKVEDKAYKKYMSKAKSVKLSSSLKKKVRSGDYSISDYSSATQQKIQEYQQWWDKAQDAKSAKYEAKKNARDKKIERYQLYVDKYDAKREASQAEVDLNAGNYKKQNKELEKQKKYVKTSYDYQIKIAKAEGDTVKVDELKAKKQKEINDLTKQEFDNISNTYDKKLEQVKNKSDFLNTQISGIESKGYVVSENMYQSMMQNEQKNIPLLEDKLDKLRKKRDEAVADGTVKKGTDAWYEMQNKIWATKTAIEESKNALVEYENQIRQLKWDAFDRQEDFISQIQSEGNFLIDLMSNEKLFDDNGNWTEYANATAGLRAMNYNAYMAQADDYEKEIQSIQQEINNDPYNIDLIQRKQELISTQRELIKSAEQEKESIKSLVSDGYNKWLDALQKSIDLRKKELDNVSDLYAYQKNISKLAKETANYEKQWLSLQGDNSEENKSRLQKITVALQDSRDSLQESEYEQWKTDQQKMLDTLSSDAESFINERLDNIDGLISDVINTTNSNSNEIKDTLERVTSDVGITLSSDMDNIWNATNGVSNVVREYGDKVGTNLTSLGTILGEIKDYVSKIPTDITSQTDNEVPEYDFPIENEDSNLKKISDFINSNAKDANKVRSYYAALNQYIYDKTGGKVLSKADEATLGKMLNVSIKTDLKGDKGRVELERILAALKLTGFAKGGTIGKAIKRSGEDGFILARTGEEVLSLEKIKALGYSLNALNPIISNVKTMIPTNIPVRNQNIGGNNIGDVEMNINLPNVTNYEDFKSNLIKDKQIEQFVQTVTFGNALGKNSLSKYKL